MQQSKNLPSLHLLSIIIPARDEEGCIASTVEHLHLELQLRGVPHEIIVVDDGSTDRTWQILQEEAQRLNASAPSSNSDLRSPPSDPPDTQVSAFSPNLPSPPSPSTLSPQPSTDATSPLSDPLHAPGSTLDASTPQASGFKSPPSPPLSPSSPSTLNPQPSTDTSPPPSDPLHAPCSKPEASRTRH